MHDILCRAVVLSCIVYWSLNRVAISQSHVSQYQQYQQCVSSIVGRSSQHVVSLFLLYYTIISRQYQLLSTQYLLSYLWYQRLAAHGYNMTLHTTTISNNTRQPDFYHSTSTIYRIYHSTITMLLMLMLLLYQLVHYILHIIASLIAYSVQLLVLVLVLPLATSYDESDLQYSYY